MADRSGGWRLGVLGGSGVYDVADLTERRRVRVMTPWGDPSDELLFGVCQGVELVFLPRHGRGHLHLPAEVNVRANIDALKRVGCTDIVALSAVGSLNEALAPGALVAIDQIIDRTTRQPCSFFGEGLVAHVSLADPTCPRLRGLLGEAGRSAGLDVIDGATLVVIEGPQFSTRAESRLYQGWGCDLIGMTAMPEARLAREAELPYALLAMVTDYDGWRDEDAAVEASHVVEAMRACAAKAQSVITALARRLAETPRPPSPIDRCLDSAVMTAPSARDPARLARLDAVAGRVLGLTPDPASG